MYIDRRKLFTLKNSKSPVSVLNLWRRSQQKQLTFLLACATDMAASCMCLSAALIIKPTVEKTVMKRGHYLHHVCQENTSLEVTTSIYPLTTLTCQWYGWLQEFCITQKNYEDVPSYSPQLNKRLHFHEVDILYGIICTAQDLKVQIREEDIRWTLRCFAVRADKDGLTVTTPSRSAVRVNK
jgi:hypothetical protein